MSEKDVAELRSQKRPDELPSGIMSEQLKLYHPEVKDLVESVPSLGDAKKIQDELAFFYEMLFDPKLEDIYQAHRGQFTELIGFIDQTDFALHLAEGDRTGNTDWHTYQFTLPGAPKYENDTAGHSAGDALLRFIANHMLDALARSVPSARIVRNGFDFTIAVPASADTHANDAFSVASVLTEEFAKFPTYPSAAGVLIPLLPVITRADVSLPKQTEGVEAKDVVMAEYGAIRGEHASAQWQETITALRKKYASGNTANLTVDDWNFLAYYFDPFTDRGNTRLMRIGTPLIEKLSTYYYDPKAPADGGKSGVREGQIEPLKALLLQILGESPEQLSEEVVPPSEPPPPGVPPQTRTGGGGANIPGAVTNFWSDPMGNRNFGVLNGFFRFLLRPPVMSLIDGVRGGGASNQSTNSYRSSCSRG